MRPSSFIGIIGHGPELERPDGAAEAIASVLSLRRGQVPATVGTVDVEDGMAIDVVRDRPRTAPQSRAVSLSLGFGGHNVALVIDRAA